MNRYQLEHIIRAACGNAETDQIVIVGSQSILGQFPDAPADFLDSIEADVYPLDNPDRSILIDGAIGENSLFHQTHGYYAHGVSDETAALPDGWKERLIPVQNENTRYGTGWCLEIHDLVSSKLAAGREKDIDFVAAALRYEMIDTDVLRERLVTLPRNSSLAEERIDGLLKRIKVTKSQSI